MFPDAAVTEVPTGISTEMFDFSRDRTYSPEWEELFEACCTSGKELQGIVLLMLMYSNNIDYTPFRVYDPDRLKPG